MAKTNIQSDLKLENAVLFYSVSRIPFPLVRPPYPDQIAVNQFLSLDEKQQKFPILLSDVYFKFNFSHSGHNKKNSDKIAIIVPYANIPQELRDKTIGDPYEVNIFAEFLSLKELKPVILLPKSMQEDYQASLLGSIDEITPSYYDDHLTMKEAFSNYAIKYNIPTFRPLGSKTAPLTEFNVSNGCSQQKIGASVLFGRFFKSANYVKNFCAHPLSLFQDLCLRLQRTIELRQTKCLLTRDELTSIESFLENESKEIFYGSDAEYNNATSFMNFVTTIIRRNQTIDDKDIFDFILQTKARRRQLYQERYSKCNIQALCEQKASTSYDFKILSIFLAFCLKLSNIALNAISSIVSYLGKLDLKDVLLTLFNNIKETSPERLAKKLSASDTLLPINAYTLQNAQSPDLSQKQNSFSLKVTQERSSNRSHAITPQ